MTIINSYPTAERRTLLAGSAFQGMTEELSRDSVQLLRFYEEAKRIKGIEDATVAVATATNIGCQTPLQPFEVGVAPEASRSV